MDNQTNVVDNQIDDIADDVPIASDNFDEEIPVLLDDSDIVYPEDVIPFVINYFPDDEMPVMDDSCVVCLTDSTPATEYVYIYLDIDHAVENQVIEVTPTMYYYSTPITGGTLNIYSDYERKNLIASIESGSSFNYTVPDCPDDLCSKGILLYYNFESYDAETNTKFIGRDDFTFSTIHTNNMNISAETDDYEKNTDSISIKEGESFILNLDNIDFRSASPAKIYIEGFESPIACFFLDNLLDTQRIITLDPALFSAGEYNIYVKYDGYVYDNYMSNRMFVAPAISNMIKVIVEPNE